MARVTGVVSELLAEEGDLMKAGEPLLKLANDMSPEESGQFSAHLAAFSHMVVPPITALLAWLMVSSMALAESCS